MRKVCKIGIVFAGVLGLCIMGGSAWGLNITIPDGMLPNTTWAGYSLPGNVGNENNEVEANCVPGAAWDLEGMYVGHQQLTLTGTWNFLSGEAHADSYAGTPWYEDGRFTSGDIFISTQGGAPTYGNTGVIHNPGLASSWGYEYILDVDWQGFAQTGLLNYAVLRTQTLTGAQAEVVYYDQNDGSNPWLYTTGGAAVTHGFGGPAVTGVAGHAQGVAGEYGATNTVTFDLSWMFANDTGVNVLDTDTLYFHFTQECGNDNMMGSTTGAITRKELVPEPASVGLLGMGLVGLVATRMRRKQS